MITAGYVARMMVRAKCEPLVIGLTGPKVKLRLGQYILCVWDAIAVEA